MKKIFYVEFVPAYSFSYGDEGGWSEAGFFAGFEENNPFAHIISKDKKNALMMTKQKAQAVCNKIDRWNSRPLGAEVKTDQLELF